MGLTHALKDFTLVAPEMMASFLQVRLEATSLTSTSGAEKIDMDHGLGKAFSFQSL